MDGWVVVCQDLHVAVGPFPSWEEAEADAIRETKASMGDGTGCVYQAVRFVTLKKNQANKTEAPTHDKGRGYL